MPKKSTSVKPTTSVILPEALLLRVANALKASNTELALELQEAITLFKKQAPEGYVWSDEFDGGCFVYAYEDHPKDARAVYVLN